MSNEDQNISRLGTEDNADEGRSNNESKRVSFSAAEQQKLRDFEEEAAAAVASSGRHPNETANRPVTEELQMGVGSTQQGPPTSVLISTQTPVSVISGGSLQPEFLYGRVQYPSLDQLEESQPDVTSTEVPSNPRHYSLHQQNVLDKDEESYTAIPVKAKTLDGLPPQEENTEVKLQSRFLPDSNRERGTDNSHLRLRSHFFPSLSNSIQPLPSNNTPTSGQATRPTYTKGPALPVGHVGPGAFSGVPGRELERSNTAHYSQLGIPVDNHVHNQSIATGDANEEEPSPRVPTEEAEEQSPRVPDEEAEPSPRVPNGLSQQDVTGGPLAVAALVTEGSIRQPLQIHICSTW